MKETKCTAGEMSRTALRLKGRIWKLGITGITISGGWLLYRQIRSVKDTVSQAMPVEVMTGSQQSLQYLYFPNRFVSQEGDSYSWEMLVPYSHLEYLPSLPGLAAETPWHMVNLARSSDKKKREKGLKALSELRNLDVSYCRQVAQASDLRMAVGLARLRNCNINMLLPPPAIPLTVAKSDAWEDLMDLLSLLPIDNGQNCAQYLTSLALQGTHFSRHGEDNDWWLGTGKSIKYKSKPFFKMQYQVRGTIILEALLSHSSNAERRRQILQLKGLLLLMKLCTTKREDVHHQSLVAQILGNVAQDPSCHDQIFQSGWITKLAMWSRSPNLDLSLPAAKALANLDYEYVNATFEDGIYLAHPLHRDNKSDVVADVIFVHGLLGGAFKTWRQRDPHVPEEGTADHTAGQKSPWGEEGTPVTTSYTYCWPKDWLAEDCPNLRIILVDYDTKLSEWGRQCPYDNDRRTLKQQSVELLEKFQKASIGDRPIIWVAHSMGGLLVKQMLVQSQKSQNASLRKISENTRGVAFYSVPHRGTSMANFKFGSRYLLLPSPEVYQLQLGSKMLQQLHDDFLHVVRWLKLSCISFAETRKTSLGGMQLKAMFVTRESAEMGFEEFHLVDTDHLYICKPSTRGSPIYSDLLNFIYAAIGPSLGCVDNVAKSEFNTHLGLILSADFT